MRNTKKPVAAQKTAAFLRSVTWPWCTKVYGCDHTIIHESPRAARAYTEAHLDDYVNRNGFAVCTCHDPEIAKELGITAFPCTHDTGGAERP